MTSVACSSPSSGPLARYSSTSTKTVAYTGPRHLWTAHASDVTRRTEPHYCAPRRATPGQRGGQGGAGHTRLSRPASYCRPLHAAGTARAHFEDDGPRQRDV